MRLIELPLHARLVDFIEGIDGRVSVLAGKQVTVNTVRLFLYESQGIVFAFILLNDSKNSHLTVCVTGGADWQDSLILLHETLQNAPAFTGR